jgi:hypothetical protein
MHTQPTRRLHQSADLPNLLQLAQEQIDWLVKTGQLNPIRIAGEVRFDSRDIDRLIKTYKAIANRRNSNVEV